MKCDLCPSPATVFLTQLFNGEIKKTKFCQSCADSQGVTDPTGFALTDMLGSDTEETEADSPIDIEEDAIELGISPPSLTKCPNCGFTIKKLRDVGRLGCSECYQSFKQDIDPMLRGMHGAHEHKGKKPSLVAPAKPGGHEIKQLENQLQSAISTENFEEAARIRDQIEQLKSNS